MGSWDKFKGKSTAPYSYNYVLKGELNLLLIVSTSSFVLRPLNSGKKWLVKLEPCVLCNSGFEFIPIKSVGKFALNLGSPKLLSRSSWRKNFEGCGFLIFFFNNCWGSSMNEISEFSSLHHHNNIMITIIIGQGKLCKNSAKQLLLAAVLCGG